jgi:hypothetical protein
LGFADNRAATFYHGDEEVSDIIRLSFPTHWVSTFLTSYSTRERMATTSG